MTYNYNMLLGVTIDGEWIQIESKCIYLIGTSLMKRQNIYLGYWLNIEILEIHYLINI